MSATTTITSPPEITADNVATLFPEVDTSLAREVLPTSQTNTARGSELEGYDEEQVRLMDEVCIVLDNNDRPIGSASKKTCTFHDPIITRRDTEWRGTGHNMRDRTLTDAFA
jgi:isopentenyl-diphosphate delta-isomerase